jgi:AAA family ATP:ADP antiporter
LIFRSLIPGIQKGERTKTALMFLYFFIIIACYWFLKPVRSALTVEKLGADSIRELKLITAFVSAGVVVLYSIMVSRLSRERLVYLVLGTFFWLLVFFSLSFHYLSQVKVLYYCFYIFLDLFVTVNVTLFWTFLADILNLDSAKRLYGFIGAGGILGGFFGSFSCNSLVEVTGPATMMLMVTAAYTLVFFLVFGLSRRMDALHGKDSSPVAPTRNNKLQDALEGARGAISSPYFVLICVLLSCYEIVSTVNDFSFHKSVELAFAAAPDDAHSLLGLVSQYLGALFGIDLTGFLSGIFGVELGRHSLESFFSEFFLLVNIIAVLAQFLLTPLLLRHMTLALFFLPATILAFSTGFFFLPLLTTMEVLFLSDNAFNYSVNQTSREMLFVPARRPDKFKTMAFIDMFVGRSAKALAGFVLVLLPLLVTVNTIEDLRWYMVITVGISLLWLAVAVAVGAGYKKLCAQRHAEDAKPCAQP